MHRIPAPSTHAAPSFPLPTSAAQTVSAGKFTPRPTVGAPCAVFTPLHYEPNYAYPLLIWLHGRGTDENQLKRIMPLVSMRNYVAVAPRGVATDQRRAATTPAWPQSSAAIALAEQRVFEALDLAMERFHFAAHRVFLAGADVGGTMAFRIALNNPTTFAGALSLGGEFPRGQTPLARLNEARRLQLFLACGRESDTLPAETVCENLRLFHAAGIEADVRQYPGRHEFGPLALADVDRWIMQRIHGSTSSPSATPSPRDG